MAEGKSAGEALKETLFYTPKKGSDALSQEEIAQADLFCEEYLRYLNTAKTERETVNYLKTILDKEGYCPFSYHTRYQPGDKIYFDNHGKSLVMVTIGQRPLQEGIRMVAAHIDSPRLDLKPSPLYEQEDLALFKTHYYGGIKKYQWTAIPLSLHGVLIKKNGEKVVVNIGEDAGDPIFCVTDLLPHLAKEQLKRSLDDGVRGEELNVLVGSRSFQDDQVSERVKLNVLSLLHQKYGIVEEDFLRAELEMVPALTAKDLGFDRSMIAAYGHDDRVCAYTAFRAEIDTKQPVFTTVTVLADKEEIGSVGNTGSDSNFLEYFLADLCEGMGENYRLALHHTQCLSADVNAALDPTFSDVSEKQNSCRLNSGVVVTKYTGARGKSGTNDASAEFVASVLKDFDSKHVLWQTGELGKVDAGGGGTVAMFVAALTADVVDVGVPVLSMHAPYEVVSKIDVYMAFKAFKAFYQA